MTTTEIKCPKCGSTQLTANKKGFSGTKAIGGAILTGGIGLLAGTIGSNKIKITCLACGNQFNPGGDLEGVKKKQQQQAEAMKSPVFWIFFVVIMLLFFWVLKGCFSIFDSSDKDVNSVKNDIETSTAGQLKIPDAVKYETIDEWNITNGGKGKVIVVDNRLTNLVDLKKLGECLNYEAKNDRNSYVVVFNNKKAAQMFHSAADLNDRDGAFYDKHFLAVYNKNINTNLNEIQIHEKGLNGKSTEVKY